MTDVAEKVTGMRAELWMFVVEMISSIALFPVFWIPMVCLAALGFTRWWPFSWHFMAMCFWDDVSTAVANPAVVVASGLSGGMKRREVGIRLVAQTFAALVAFWFMKDFITLPPAVRMHEDMGGPKLAKSVSLSTGIWVEGGLTALLIVGLSIIAKLTSFPVMVRRALNALLVRLLINTGSNLTGGCMNPLVSMAWLVYNIRGWGYDQRYGYLLTYVVAPIVGAVVGSITFDLCVSVVTPSINPITIAAEQKRKRR